MLEVSTPGRICLFGEDLDYMGLNVITAAINLRMHVRGDFSDDDFITIYFKDLDERDRFRINQPAPYRKKRDYIRAATNVLNRKGYEINRGIKATIWSEIPIGRGLSSSSVLTISWIAFVNELFEFGLTKKEIAELAYQSEVVENNESGGNMDHYACSLGNGMHLNCSTHDVKILELNHLADSIVIADTKIIKKELVHGERKKNIIEGLEWFSKFVDFDLKNTCCEDLEPFFSKIPPIPLKHARAILRLRDITNEAEKVLSRPESDPEKLGRLFDEFHHELVRGFDNSTEMTEKIILEAKKAGALGGKILGSGFGGCVLLYCPGKQKEVSEAVKKSGGEPYIVCIDEGIRIEHED
ncbi:MAG: GHMP family kinase ATP-binding protein [Candidatus Helarchaeota archaeon]